jgi:uncharacterized Fe-S cluster-containing radical SAM superfamily protein
MILGLQLKQQWLSNQGLSKMNYYELEPEDNHFHTLLADVTHRCNMECANCYIPNRTIPDMDKVLLENFLKRLPTRTDIRLIGAEATMRDDLPELIRMIKSSGHHVALLTNGLKLGHLSYCQTLKDAGLRSLGLSMNGADSDEIYKVIDNGKYATLKTRALDHCFNLGFVTHINCIISKDVNEHYAPKRLCEMVTESALRHNRRFRNLYPIMLRFKSIGEIGRYMPNSSYTLKEMIELVSDSLEISNHAMDINTQIDGYQECNSVKFVKDTQAGPLQIKITDWSVDDDGVPDSGSHRRGRITPDWKCAPFFEHVKLNEMEY